MSAHELALTELVAPPALGRVFAQEMRGGLADSSPGGRVRLDALARWAQDVAYADVEDAGLASAAAWVVRKMRMRVARFPRFGEHVVARTFCSGLGRMWAERRTTLTRAGAADADVETVALWVHLDPQSLRPTPLSDTELNIYGPSAGPRTVRARLRHPSPTPDAYRRPWSFRACELDLAGHVNNAAYWQPLEEELLSGPEPTRIDAEIEFRTPAQPGGKTIASSGPMRWLADAGGELHASLAVVERNP